MKNFCINSKNSSTFRLFELPYWVGYSEFWNSDFRFATSARKILRNLFYFIFLRSGFVLGTQAFASLDRQGANDFRIRYAHTNEMSQSCQLTVFKKFNKLEWFEDYLLNIYPVVQDDLENTGFSRWCWFQHSLLHLSRWMINAVKCSSW